MSTSMEEQDKTFNRLRRIPYEEMDERIKSIPKQPPIFNLGNNNFESKKHELVRHYEVIRLLEKHGWDLESFVLETEKKNILEAINQYNQDCKFPMELVGRALEFFPNAKFTQAKIELE